MLLAATANVNGQFYRLDALPDPADFRDYLFRPTLVEVPVSIELDDYRVVGAPVRDQGREGSCTGFALSTVAHYLLRARKAAPDEEMVSARMLYQMAKRYDEWEGEQYQGSSSRGAMKGWHKHGVCCEEIWSYRAHDDDLGFTTARAEDALLRPLGAYFRVNPFDLVAMHSALAEVGVLFVTATIHDGWYVADPATGQIPYQAGVIGAHAFAIVGYNQDGFWIQNSWGKQWGQDGFGLLTYDDWLLNAMDVWVARLGAPVKVVRPEAQAVFNTSLGFDNSALSLRKVRAHVIRVHHDGTLNGHGKYATVEHDVKRIITDEFVETTKRWQRKRLLIYAGGGLFSERESIERMSHIGAQLLKAEIYPLGLIWGSGLLGVMQTVIDAAVAHVAPPHCDMATERFMRDRLDDAIEPHVRRSAAKLIWDDYKEVGYRATKNEAGAARILLHGLEWLTNTHPDVELHVVAHSAGSIFLAPLIQLMTAPADQKLTVGPMKDRHGSDLHLTTCTLWAPAITSDLFKATYLPAIEQNGIGRFALYTLTDEAERHDCCIDVYKKSLLYLIANALEKTGYIPMRRVDRHPLVGMEAGVYADKDLRDLFASGMADWVLAPNDHWLNTVNASRSMSHLRFDEDATLLSTMQRICRD